MHYIGTGHDPGDLSPVVTVHHKDETLGVLEVMSPQRTDLVLTAHIPHSKTDVFVFNCLNVESCKMLKSYRSAYCHCCNVIPIVGMVVTISPSFSL